MCVVSMIMDHFSDEWNRRYPRPFEPIPMPQPNPPWPGPLPYPQPQPRGPTQEEVDEFRRLLERARKYDQEHNQPDCELEEKRRKIKELAEQLGVDVSFV